MDPPLSAQELPKHAPKCSQNLNIFSNFPIFKRFFCVIFVRFVFSKSKLPANAKTASCWEIHKSATESSISLVFRPLTCQASPRIYLPSSSLHNLLPKCVIPTCPIAPLYPNTREQEQYHTQSQRLITHLTVWTCLRHVLQWAVVECRPNVSESTTFDSTLVPATAAAAVAAAVAVVASSSASGIEATLGFFAWAEAGAWILVCAVRVSGSVSAGSVGGLSGSAFVAGTCEAS